MKSRLYLDNCSFNRPYDDQSLLKNYLEAEAKTYIQKEPFDYTKWQENLFENMTVEEISKKASEYRENN
jgi:hypothetical protein